MIIYRTKEFWDMIEISRLRGMFLEGDMTIGQMADRLGRSHSATEKKLARIGLKRQANDAVRRYSDDFKASVIAYYYTTNSKETCARFDIAERVLEGILLRDRRSRKIPSIKIGERKNEYRINDVLTMLRYLGLKPIPYIAQKLNKTPLAIESYLKRRGFRLHYINGLRREDFNKNFRPVKALPFMRTLDDQVFIPWVTMEDNMDSINGCELQNYVIKSMAKFQRSLHRCNENKEVIAELWLKMEEQ